MADPLTENIRVRLTPGERELIEQTAEREGRKLSGLIRHATVTYCTSAGEPAHTTTQGRRNGRRRKGTNG